MTTDNILDTVKKHGALGVTMIALIWMNSRLNSVEERLYRCYDDKFQAVGRSSNNTNKQHEQTLAILPIKNREDEKNNRKNKG